MRQEQQVHWPRGFQEGGLRGPWGPPFHLPSARSGSPGHRRARSQGWRALSCTSADSTQPWPGLGPKSMRNAGGTVTDVLLVTTTSLIRAAARALLTGSPHPC